MAAGMVHAQPRMPPITTITAAIATRKASGSGRSVFTGGASELFLSTAIHSAHRCGAMTYETADTSAVAPSAMASDRHSRRARCQRIATPGVTLVSSGNAQATGTDTARTAAAAVRKWMLPDHSALPTSGKASVSSAAAGRIIQASSSTLIPVHVAYQTVQRRNVNGSPICAKAGE